MVFVIELLILVTVGVAVTLIVNKVQKGSSSKNDVNSDLIKFHDRITEIEKWCEKFTGAFNQNTDSYNRNKNAMLEEIKTLTKFVGDAGDLVNSNVDDIKDLEEALLEAKNTIVKIEKEIKPIRRKVRYNISSYRY
jgi:chromosome segregation ATPase